MTPARSSWRRLPAAVLTAGVAALSAVPVAVLPAALPAAATMRTPTAGPVETSCVGAHRYAAEAGAQLLRLHRLDLRPAGHTEPPVTGIGLGTARSVLVAESPINSAAAAQVLDGHVSEQAAPAALTRQLYQQAPPDNRAPRRSTVAAQQAGPLSIGAAKLASHARWLAPMACGAGWGEVTAAQTGLAGATLLTGTGGRALISVPAGLTSLSSTALDRRGANVHTVARAAATMPDIRLLAGAVRLRVLRPPRLQTSIAASPGSAEVRYAAPSIEVSGRGLATRRLDAPGDTVEIMLADDPGRTESTPAVPGDPLDTLLSDVPADALAGLVGGDTTEPDLPEPPGVPTVPGGRSAGRAGPDDGGAAGELVRISLGEVRQAAAGQAIAARAVAVQVQVVAGATASGPGGVVLDLDLAVLEAAAVAPEPGTVGGAGGQADGVDGVDGVDGADRTTVVAAGLPVTGANVDTVLLAGGLLLAAGTALLLIGLHGIHRARRKASS